MAVLGWWALVSVTGTIGSDVFEHRRAGDPDPVTTSIADAREAAAPFEVARQWFVWDSQHYARLSSEWFDVRRPLEPTVVTESGGRAWDQFSWPPLYPVAVGIVSAATRLSAPAVMLLAGPLVFAALLVLVRQLALADGHDRRTAAYAVAANLAAPFAFFLAAPLTEGLFVLLAAGSLLAARHQRWLLAGALAALMPWTKTVGAAMIVPLGIAAALELRAHRRSIRDGWRVVAMPVMVAGSALAYLGFAWYLTGTPNAPFLTQRHGWGNTVGNPLGNLVSGLDRWQYVVVTAMLLGTVVAASRRVLSLVDASYCTVMLLAAAAVPQIVGAAPRYAAVAFPLFSAAGIALSTRRWGPAVLVGSGVLQLTAFSVWVSFWLAEMF